MGLIFLGLLVVVLDVIALGNILFSSMSGLGKLLWVLIVLLLPVVGMLLYLRSGKRRNSGLRLKTLRTLP